MKDFRSRERKGPSSGHVSKCPMDRRSIKKLVRVRMGAVVGGILVAKVSPHGAALCVSALHVSLGVRVSLMGERAQSALEGVFSHVPPGPH